MAEYVIQGETLTAIADAIRAKTAAENDIPTTAMAEEIMSIATTMLPENITAIATGEFTLATTSYDYSITHNLGVVPNFLILYTKTMVVGPSDVNTLLWHFRLGIDHRCDSYDGNVPGDAPFTSFMTNANGTMQVTYKVTDNVGDIFKTDTVSVKQQAQYLTRGFTYYWIIGKAKYLVDT